MAVTQPTFRDRARASVEPVARAFGRLGLSPNALTLIGFGIAVVAAWQAALQAWLVAGVLVAFGAAFDMLDGALARATGRLTRLGAFMDSVFDRAGEAIVYLGIAAGLLASGMAAMAILPVAAMTAAFMVSYTRARAEGLGFATGRGLAAVGLAPREVRTIFVVVGLVLTGLAGGVGSLHFPNAAGTTAMTLSFGLIAILATITTIQRIVFVYLQAKKEQ
jgi:CDP-diacylglycerol---glycerol-3-phosphate 3-phosphatidyltransferase